MSGVIEHASMALLKRIGTEFLKDYQRQRAVEARDTLLNALAQGKTYRITDDQAAAAIFAYMRAAEEGAARLNLGMIAEAFANAAQEPTFAPDVFRRHTRMLADLSREEIIVVAQLIKANRVAQTAQPNEVGQTILRELDRALVGPDKFFKSRAGFYRHLGALQRTGIVVGTSAGFGHVYMPTGLLDEIERLVDFDRASAEVVAPKP